MQLFLSLSTTEGGLAPKPMLGLFLGLLPILSGCASSFVNLQVIETSRNSAFLSLLFSFPYYASLSLSLKDPFPQAEIQRIMEERS